MMFIQGKRLLIVGLKFLQGNGYTSTLKEKDTCQIKINEWKKSITFVVAFFVKKIVSFLYIQVICLAKKVV